MTNKQVIKDNIGNLTYDANTYDGMNTKLTDLQCHRRWLLENKEAHILQLYCVTAKLKRPISKDGYDSIGVH